MLTADDAIKIINKKVDSLSYGKIKISFENGKVVGIEDRRTFKDSKDIKD